MIISVETFKLRGETESVFVGSVFEKKLKKKRKRHTLHVSDNVCRDIVCVNFTNGFESGPVQ